MVRLDRIYAPVLEIDWPAVPVLEINAYDTATIGEMAPVIDGNPFRDERLTLEKEILALLGLEPPPAPSTPADLAHPRGEHSSFAQMAAGDRQNTE